MTNSSKSSDVSSNGSTCFPGKIISYSCKIRLMVLVCFILLASALALIYFLLAKSTANQEKILALPKKLDWFPQCPSTLLEPTERFDCYPDDRRITKEACENRGCCYLGPLIYETNATSEGKTPICVYPSNYGYEASGKAAVTSEGFEVPLRRIPAPSRYGDDFQTVYMKVEMQTKYRLRIKFYDPENARYEVPVPKISAHSSSQPQPESTREILMYSITYNTFSSPFAVKVRRSSTDTVLFDTSLGALTLSNQFLELSSKLPSLKLFGLGRQKNRKFQKFDWETIPIFSSITKDGNFASSVHPFYLCVEEDGNAHGVLLLNSNAMEILLHPSPAITYRTIGGILDFYLFLGPTPEEVVQQYTEAVGRPMIPPYWSLGFHVGVQKYQSANQVMKMLDNLQAKYVPIESLIIKHDDISKYLSGTKEFWNFSNITTKLTNKSQKLQIHFEPGILKSSLIRRDEMYNVGPLNDVFITDKWGLHPIAGKNGNEDAFFPDFGSSPGFIWWSSVINKISSAVEYHGFWLANNEPLNSADGSISGCLRDDLNNPPYLLAAKQTLYDHSLCMDSLLHWRDDVITFYDYHNLYGHSMIMATEQAFSFNDAKKRRLILSDSTFIGSGQYSGHWIKGLENSWDGLRSSISAVFEQGLIGLPLSGSYVCDGDNEDLNSTKDELCLRWLQLGVFFPFIQVYAQSAEYLYNAAVSSNEFIHAARHSISRRYELLPYLYTLFYLAHTNGSTVFRPLFHEFPSENETYYIDSQFLWGSSLLISPILEQGANKLDFYLPEGLWYDFYQGTSIFSSGEWFQESGGPFVDTKQPAVIHIRAGSMIVLQKPAETTYLSRQNSMSLLVALDASSEASGLLFWDDGETKNSHILGEYILVDFIASGSSFVVTGNFGKKAVMSSFYRALIQQVRIMGLPKPPKRIVIDGGYILSNKQYYWNYDTKVLDLKHILIPLARRTEVQWYF